MGQVTVRLDDEVTDWIEERLYPGQRKAVVYRYMIHSHYEIDRMLDELFEPHEYEDRQEFVEEAIEEAVEEAVEEA